MSQTEEDRRWRDQWRQEQSRRFLAYLIDWVGFLKYGATVTGKGWRNTHGAGPTQIPHERYPKLTAAQEADCELYATRKIAGMWIYELTKLVYSTTPMLITSAGYEIDLVQAERSWRNVGMAAGEWYKEYEQS